MFQRLRRFFLGGFGSNIVHFGQRSLLRVGSAGLGTLVFFLVGLVVLVFVGLYLLWLAFMLFVWNAVLVPHTGAALITTAGGAVLFLLGIGCFGRLIGVIALLWALVLFVSGGTGSWLDMTMGAGPMALYAIYCLFFGGVMSRGNDD